jgi:hypothetical protein
MVRPFSSKFGCFLVCQSKGKGGARTYLLTWSPNPINSTLDRIPFFEFESNLSFPELGLIHHFVGTGVDLFGRDRDSKELLDSTPGALSGRSAPVPQANSQNGFISAPYFHNFARSRGQNFGFLSRVKRSQVEDSSPLYVLSLFRMWDCFLIS